MPPARGKRWKPILLVIGAFLGACVGLAGILFYTSGKGIPQDIAAIHAMGIPTTDKELSALAPQTGEDAGPIYKTYIDQSRVPNPKRSAALETLNPGFQSYSLAQRENAANIMRPFLKPIVEGSKMPRWVFSRDSVMNISDQAELDRHKVQEGGRLLSHIAMADYETGDRQDAMTELRQVEQMSQQVGQNPGLINAAEARFLDEDVHRVLFKIVKDRPGDPIALADSLDFLKLVPPPPEIRAALGSYFVDQVDFYNLLEKPNEDGDKPPLSIREWFHDEVYRRQKVLDIHPYREAFSKLQNTDWSASSARQVFLEIANRYRKSPFYSGMPAELASFTDMWPRWIADRRLAVACLRLLQIKAETGALPATLPDFGENSIDPFSGKPFIYKPSGKSFTIYSIGADRMDDGGRHPKSAGDKADVVYNF
jgi:hypothetical protein